MRRRRRSNAARLLAVVALAGAGVAVVLVVENTTSGTSSSSTTSTTSTTAKAKVPGRFKERKYRVRRGDTLGLISTRSGIDIPTLEDLNPGIDANSLNAGQVITLRRPKKR